MRIETPNGVLEGGTIAEIIEKHGKDCLQGTDMQGADLRNADLSHADMRHADLYGADLQGADLRGTDLREYAAYHPEIAGIAALRKEPEGDGRWPLL